MGGRVGVAALWVVAGCASPQSAVVLPSALDPGLSSLDAEVGRRHEYPVVAIERFDGFLAEAARVEATMELARHLRGELRTAMTELAIDRGVPRAKQRPFPVLARELAARGQLEEKDRDRLERSAGPLATLLPHLGTVAGEANRLLVDGTALLEDAHRDLGSGKPGRLAPALDAVNVAIEQLRNATNQAPRLLAELGPTLDELSPIAPSVKRL